MPDYRYLIVGGGMTADAACRGIRDHDAEGSIGLISEEPDPPYSRPPLSKALWQGKAEETIWRGTAELGVELHLGRRVVALDLAGRRVDDERGESHGYEQLLLATGGRPRRLPGDAGAEVVYFRELPDYRRLRALADRLADFVVLGGGFIGSELAAALRGAGCRVTLVFPEAGIGARLFPAELAASVTELYRGHGVEVLPGELVAGVESEGERFAVALASGARLAADAVVAGLGVEPRTELAAAAGLPVSDGIVVDEYGRDRRDRGRVRGRRRRAGSRRRCSGARSGSSTRTRPTAMAARSGPTWRAPACPTTTCPSSTPTCSSSATRPSARSTRAWRRSPSGSSRCGRGPSPTSTRRAGRAGSCSSTSGARSTGRPALIAAREPLAPGALAGLLE